MSNAPAATKPAQPTAPTPPEPTHRMQRFAVVPRTHGDDQIVSMPKGAEIGEAIFYEGRVYFWARCPIDGEPEDRTFRCIDDGDGFAADTVNFVAFVVRPSGKAIHVVEVIG